MHTINPFQENNDDTNPKKNLHSINEIWVTSDEVIIISKTIYINKINMCMWNKLNMNLRINNLMDNVSEMLNGKGIAIITIITINYLV